MNLFILKDRIDYFHKLIQKESTGAPCEFAERLNLKRSQLFNIIDEFRDYGAEIGYCRRRQTYYYKNAFEIQIEIRLLSDGEQRKFFAGSSKKVASVQFFWTESS